MQEVLTEENIKKYEQQSWASYKGENYESALCHTLRWKELIEKKYGYGSAETAHCLRRLGQIYYAMKLPVREFEAEYGRFDSPMPFWQYLLLLARPFYWLPLNLQRPMEFFQEGYDLLKKAKGATAPETLKHKRLYVEFLCQEVLAAHLEETLWILLALVPLLIFLVPLMAGLSWHSLGVGLLMIGVLVTWRMMGATFFFFMTKRHYERVIQ